MYIISHEISSPDPPFFSHSLEIVLHSILTCRLMIGIREAGQSYGRKSDTFELSEVPRHSTIVFAHGPPGENPWIDPEAHAGPSKA